MASQSSAESMTALCLLPAIVTGWCDSAILYAKTYVVSIVEKFKRIGAQEPLCCTALSDHFVAKFKEDGPEWSVITGLPVLRTFL